jgi:hypothetical protein
MTSPWSSTPCRHPPAIATARYGVQEPPAWLPKRKTTSYWRSTHLFRHGLGTSRIDCWYRASSPRTAIPWLSAQESLAKDESPCTTPKPGPCAGQPHRERGRGRICTQRPMAGRHAERLDGASAARRRRDDRPDRRPIPNQDTFWGFVLAPATMVTCSPNQRSTWAMSGTSTHPIGRRSPADPSQQQLLRR